MTHGTDNEAVMKCYTRAIEGWGVGGDLYLLVKPDTNLDGTFLGFDTNEQEWLYVNGWNYSWSDSDA